MEFCVTTSAAKGGIIAYKWHLVEKCENLFTHQALK